MTQLNENIEQKYLKHLCIAIGTKPCHANVLIKLLDKAEETNDGLAVLVYKPVKQEIANTLNISLNSVNNALIEMSKVRFLSRTDRGRYIFNKDYFGIQRWDNFTNVITAYDYGTGRIKAIFSNSDIMQSETEVLE